MDLCRQIIMKDMQGSAKGNELLMRRRGEGLGSVARKERKKGSKRRGNCVVL